MGISSPRDADQCFCALDTKLKPALFRPVVLAPVINHFRMAQDQNRPIVPLEVGQNLAKANFPPIIGKEKFVALKLLMLQSGRPSGPGG
jgi:hypothetical protein